jgi:hypothetical protein
MCTTTICSTKPDSAKLDGLVSGTEGSRISKNSDDLSEKTTTDPNDWRTPLACYLESPSHIADRKVQ